MFIRYGFTGKSATLYPDVNRYRLGQVIISAPFLYFCLLVISSFLLFLYLNNYL